MTQKFNVSQFVGQFILRNGAMPVPEGWAEKRIGTWHLAHHASLPAILLHGVDGSPVGWILGYPIDGNGLLLSDGDERNLPGPSNSTESEVEDFIYGFGGRFLAALVGVSHPRIYLDPCGSLSAVYCPHQEVVTSTHYLISYDEHCGDHVDLARDLGIPDTNAMYPLELTPRHNVFRLLPNHYLDLSTWCVVRHWPKGPIRSEGSVDDLLPAIASSVNRNISAVVLRVPAYLYLTAGMDSRMLLACAKNFADRLVLFTVPIPDDDAYIDTVIARKIARHFHIRHFMPPFQPSTKADLDMYMERIGYSTGERRGWQAATMFKMGNPSYAHLLGNVGEVARTYWCRKEETENSSITPERLLEPCQAPASPLTLPPVERWLETVPAGNAIQVLDLFYIEQRLGCWGGVWPYAQTGSPGFVLFPMCHREIIRNMLSLPTPYRRSGCLGRDVIAREWPELLAWPFNEPVGFMHIILSARHARRRLDHQAGRVGKALRNPGWAAGKIWEKTRRRLM